MREKKEINIQIGEQIKAAREQARLTQEFLAERIGVSPQYVSDLERGVVGVSVATLKKLCVALGVSSDQILFGADTPKTLPSFPAQFNRLSPRQQALLGEIIEKIMAAVFAAQTSDP